MKQSLFLINFPRQYAEGYTQAEAMRFAKEAGFRGRGGGQCRRAGHARC